MRTQELLNALAQAKGGITVKVTSDRAVVTTNYEPVVTREGATVFAAAFDVARVILRDIAKYSCPDVLNALKNYDVHSRYLQL